VKITPSGGHQKDMEYLDDCGLVKPVEIVHLG
jgi:hypothetical protein